MIPEPAEEAALLHRAAGFERCAGFYGVPAAALDQVFTWLGSAYRLRGCAARRCKFPFAAERVSDGKLVKFPCDVVRAAFLPSGESRPKTVCMNGVVAREPAGVRFARPLRVLTAVVLGVVAG